MSYYQRARIEARIAAITPTVLELRSGRRSIDQPARTMPRRLQRGCATADLRAVMAVTHGHETVIYLRAPHSGDTVDRVQKRILIVDDEPAIRDMVAFALRKAEYEPVHAGDAREAAAAIAERVPDLILLDWMLPGISGLELARRCARTSLTRDVPIIMLTARGEENDRVSGLESGVDDYVVKPFSARELLARIKAVMRRSRERRRGRHRGGRRRCASTAPRTACSPATSRSHVGPTEYRLLHFFMTHAERVYTRAQLLDHVWGGNVYVEERTVDVHIRRLRKALEPRRLEEHGADRARLRLPLLGADLSRARMTRCAAAAAGLATVAAAAGAAVRAGAARSAAGAAVPGAARRDRAVAARGVLAPAAHAALPRLAPAAAHRRTARACGRRSTRCSTAARPRPRAHAPPGAPAARLPPGRDRDARRRADRAIAATAAWSGSTSPRAACSACSYPREPRPPASPTCWPSAARGRLAARRARRRAADRRRPRRPTRPCACQPAPDPYSREQWLLVVRDITKLTRLEQVRRDFVANVSHELRTPLTVVHGYLDMMEPEDNPAWAPMVERDAPAVAAHGRSSSRTC